MLEPVRRIVKEKATHFTGPWGWKPNFHLMLTVLRRGSVWGVMCFLYLKNRGQWLKLLGMANTTAKTIENKKSNTPLLIIGGVLVLALLGGWYWFSTSKPGTKTANTNTAGKATTPKAAGIPA